MHRTRGAWLGVVLAAAQVAGARADTHTITDLDPARVYDVVVEGTTQLPGRQPDPHGVLAFDRPLTGTIQVVASGHGDVVPPSDATIYVAVRARDDAGLWSALSNVVRIDTATSPDPPPAQLAKLAFERVYPNPIRGEAVFRFTVPELDASVGEVRVTLDLFDVAGRRVGRVVDDRFQPGIREVIWSPDRHGRAYAPGLYVGVLRAGGRSARASVAIAR